MQEWALLSFKRKARSMRISFLMGVRICSMLSVVLWRMSVVLESTEREQRPLLLSGGCKERGDCIFYHAMCYL